MRYADDWTDVRSERAGRRVLGSVTRYLERRLKLSVNEAKSAVARPWRRSFLGFSFTGRRPNRRTVSVKALVRFKERVRELTQRTRGRSLHTVVVRELRGIVLGWDGYFGYAEAKSVFKEIDSWIRSAEVLYVEAVGSCQYRENLYLREEIREEMGFEKIIGSSDELKYVLFRVRQAAPTDATVLILGETGTGKGMVAHAIHGLSARKDRPMVTVNCAALPANLIESELFGREKGAFTGAYARQAGRFEIADKGTIFLDEIGEMPLELQSKLLRVLQDGEFERLGSAKTVKVDVRVIAATSRDLKEEVSAGTVSGRPLLPASMYSPSRSRRSVNGPAISHGSSGISWTNMPGKAEKRSRQSRRTW